MLLSLPVFCTLHELTKRAIISLLATIDSLATTPNVKLIIETAHLTYDRNIHHWFNAIGIGWANTLLLAREPKKGALEYADKGSLLNESSFLTPLHQIQIKVRTHVIKGRCAQEINNDNMLLLNKRKTYHTNFGLSHRLRQGQCFLGERIE